MGGPMIFTIQNTNFVRGYQAIGPGKQANGL